MQLSKSNVTILCLPPCTIQESSDMLKKGWLDIFAIYKEELCAHLDTTEVQCAGAVEKGVSL